MKKALVIILLLVVIAGGVWYFMANQDSSPADGETAGASTSEVVATVNGEEISAADLSLVETQIAAGQGVAVDSLDEDVRAQLQEQALNILIGQALLRQAVQESGTTITQERLATEMSAIKEQFPTDEEYQAALSAEGINEEGLQTRIGLELIAQAYLEDTLNLASITATDEEIQAAYEQIDAQGQELPPLEELRDQVEAFVVQQKQQAEIDAYVAELRADADIEVNL